MHFKNARNASVYAVFRAFFTQSLAKLRIRYHEVVFLSIASFNLLFSFSKIVTIHSRFTGMTNKAEL